MKIRKYSIQTEKPNIDLKICLVSDLHAKKSDKVIAAIEQIGADIIVCAGDILERLDGLADEKNSNGFEFLSLASEIAPTFYAFGNHERFGSHREKIKRPDDACEITDQNREKIDLTGVTVINDTYTNVENDVIIGGLIPAYDRPPKDPNVEFLNAFSSLEGFKILVCHQPDYYDQYLADCDIDLILSGHTHGGQWKVFGRGVYAPNQGLFPKYSSGIYHNRMVVSAGVSNTEKPIPRFFNPCEIVEINIKSI